MPGPQRARPPTPVPVPARSVRPGPGRPSAPASRSGLRQPGRAPGLIGFVGAHRLAAGILAGLVAMATLGIAVVSFTQPIVATPTAGTSPVAFASGDDITVLDGLNLVDVPTIATGGGSASITIYGIPGASALSLGEVLELRNADTADDASFTVTLSVSGTPAAALTGFTLSFVDDVSGTPTTRTWNLLTTPTLTTYTLADGETWEFDVTSLTMTAAASGSLGALTISATITQV